jgi:menaquinone-dependent protoporphyrinogen oxidase
VHDLTAYDGVVMARSGALEHRVFAGRLDVARLGPLERTMVRVARSSEGDYRDWEAVSRWASEIADALRSTAAPG